MNDGSGTLVFWILVPLFVAVGLYLIWYSRRRKKMLEAFAQTHQFMIKPEYREEMQKILDECFSIKGMGLVRSFDSLSSLIYGESIWVFSAVELLDLNPHAQSSATHFSRIVALFNISTDYDEFFILDSSMRLSQRIPGSKAPDSNITDLVKRIAVSCKARHSLSVTLTHGRGLIYFEPLVTGGETNSDINALHCIARGLSEELSGDE
jgi:hypothetical protein